MPHTPGPWHVIDSWRNASETYKETHPREIFVMAEDVGQSSICHVATLGRAATPEMHARELANAHVLAASLDLLASVREFLSLYVGTVDLIGDSVQAKLARARAAVAKAEGR